jgi:ribosomal protein L18E
MPKPRPAPAGLGAADLAAAGIGTPQSAPGGVLPPIRDMGEITPAPMPHGTAKLPGPTVPSGLGSPVGHARVSIPAGSMQEHVMNVFTNSGLPPVVGAGILLNIGSESSFNPAASGDSHQSYGFVQWYKDRKDRYLSAANKAGINPADPTFQSAYIVKDLRDNYPEVLAAMEQAKTPGEAAVIFLDGYEKPAQQYRDQRAAEYMGAAQPVWGGGSGGGNGITRSTMGGDPRQGGDIWSNVKDMAINPETGKLDKNFLLSVLSGLGTMASSPSRYLGAAMLQGLGGFANTEAGLQKQAADIGLTRAGTSQTNVGTLNDVIGGAAAYNMSVPDYAAMIGYDLPPGYVDRSGIGSTVGVIPGADGGGFAAMSAQDMATAYKSGAVGPDGIPLNQDPAFLNQMLAKMAILSSVPLYKNMVEDAQAKLAQINASGISTGSTPGSVVVNPGMRGAANDASTAEANRVATAEFRGKAMAAIPQLQGQAANIDHMVDIYSGFQPGALTDLNTNVTAILQAFGAPVSGDAAADAASAQTVVKNMTAQMIAQLSDMPGGAPRAEIDQLSKLAADPNLQPDSVRAILAMSKGMTQWQTDYYSPGMRDAFVKAGGDPYDQTGYTSWFSQASPLSKYMEDAKAAIHVKGETVEAPAAVSSSGAPLPDGTTAPDISGGKPWVVHNGKWAQ